MAQINQAVQANPAFFGRPIWTYVNVIRGPARGPTPHLARGSGHTGAASLPGNAPSLPGYLSDNAYFPSPFGYVLQERESFLQRIPRTIGNGEDGRTLVGTYAPHDFTPAQRGLEHMRQASNWQNMTFPPDFRNLLAYQQVMKYRVNSVTLAARPLDSSNYFVGYQVDPRIQAALGGSTLGYMGSQ